MHIETIRPADLGAPAISSGTFDPMQSSVPYREADQTYCNGGTTFQGIPSAKAVEPPAVVSLIADPAK